MRDTGVGIALEDQGRIFEEFGQAKSAKSTEAERVWDSRWRCGWSRYTAARSAS